MVFGLRNKTLINTYPLINIDQVFCLLQVLGGRFLNLLFVTFSPYQEYFDKTLAKGEPASGLAA